MEKQRVDILLVEQGVFTSREQAKRAVMAGEVLGKNEERVDKPGERIPTDTELHIKGDPMPYVSRGGFKLAKALKVFNIDVTGKTVLDIGSSTGGFTDVMLQNGAVRSLPFLTPMSESRPNNSSRGSHTEQVSSNQTNRDSSLEPQKRPLSTRDDLFDDAAWDWSTQSNNIVVRQINTRPDRRSSSNKRFSNSSIPTPKNTNN